MNKLTSFVSAKRLPLLVGLIAGFLALLLLQKEREEWQAQAGAGPKKQILVVGRDVDADLAINADWLDVREVPVVYVHPLAMGPDDRDLVTGVPAAHELKAGQPLLWTDIKDIRAQAEDMSALVRPNERAVVLRMNEMAGVHRLIKNNDHIDIFGTFDRSDGQTLTVPILQNVVVVATADGSEGSHGAGSSGISVSVSPQEAALLTLSQETGRLTYVLRNSQDWETVPDLQRISLDDLFEDSKRKAVQESRNIRVVKGKQ